MSVRSFLAKAAATPRSRFISMAVLVVVLLGASRLVEYIVVSTAGENWEQVSLDRCKEALAEASARFGGEHRALRRIGTDLSSHSSVRAALTDPGKNRGDLFSHVADISDAQGAGIEIYDRDGSLIAWEGPGGDQPVAEVRRALSGEMASIVSHTPTASQLVVVVPVRQASSVIGAIAVRRSLESNAPLNNPLLRRKGLDEVLSDELGVTVDFTFTGQGGPARDGRYRTGMLFGIDSTRIGSVSALRPVRSAYFETLAVRFQIFDAVLLSLLALLVTLACARQIGKMKNFAVRIALMTGLVWGARYVLLWLDVPSGIMATGIFDPSSFASKFGFGLAKSVGEMTISVVALTVNVVLIIREILRAPPETEGKRLPSYAALPLAGALSIVLFWALRGYAAVIKSAVADSTITYLDGRTILPSMELGFMMVNLFLLGGCVAIAAVVLTRFIIRLCRIPSLGDDRRALWVPGGLLLIAVAILFGIVDPNPLLTTSYRLAFGLVILAVTLHSGVFGGELRGDPVRSNIFLFLAVSGLMLYPLLDEYSHEKDRALIEVFAAEELKPVDGWLTYIVEEGLQGFDADEYREQMSEGYAGDVATLAFRRWASSLACSQGYDAMFTVTDPSGREASRFVIGGSVAAMTQADTALPLSRKKIVRLREIGTGVNALKVYSGSKPILGADSTLLGFARVVVAAGQQSLFRGETPALLRGSSQSRLESFYRRVTLMEYHDGVLITSDNPAVPINHPLPEIAAELFTDSTRMAVWTGDEFGGNSYETYLSRRTSGGTDVVGLGLRVLGFTWHIVSIVKLFVSWFVIGLLVLLIARIVMMRRGGTYRLTFRDRLLIALLITAILPLTMIALYIGVADQERKSQSIQRRLEEETQNVIYSITDHPQPGVTILTLPENRYAVEELASEIETDFNFYVDRQLRASSKQVLYNMGILDSRLSGNPYSKIVLGGERFVVQTERLGSIEYSVGYRPVLDARGDIIGVVSVPTLFRPEESEGHVVRRNAFLLGAYGGVLLAIILIASAFANRIAAPVQRLIAATRRVARGELDVRVPTAGAEGEIGELIRSFDQMTDDLRKSRDEQAKYERELAWKEMAKQVAHEIKNPLTPMRLSVQHLRRTWLDKAPQFGEILESVTRTILEQIDSLSHIASEFSHFARMPRRAMSHVIVNEVVEEAVQLFTHESQVMFEKVLETQLPEVTADREELRRALINVIRNGIQAMDGGGHIVVRTRAMDNGVLVEVTDHGKGVPDEIKSSLFQPNFSTKTDGMGLGLAIVKKTIDDLGGRVTLESVQGRGTTVSIWLPA